MDATMQTEKLIAVLGRIQADSGLPCPPLTASTKPVDDIPQFDSKVWPVATSLLSTEIGCPIPNHVNVFVDDKTKCPRSISQIADFLCTLLNQQSATKRGAA